ncbi:MAG TPA: PIN domain-containing protein [Caulobacteraceae bacterium]|nr:PIN domain-containing protein [Caulobacteraceae bacterium]
MTLSLDTNALIEIANGRARVRAAFETANQTGEEMVVCVLVAHELRFGARFSRRESEIRTAEAVLAGLPIIPFTAEDANGATDVRLALERIGRRIGAMDMLIAGQAFSRGWSIVTANVHEFGRIEGLDVIDWSADAESA